MLNMKTRPYLTFDGKCNEAIELYKKAFNAEAMQVLKLGDMPNNESNANNAIGENQKDKIIQATLKMGDDFIRMSDCFGGLNVAETELISIAVECSVNEVKHAFTVLAEDGRVGIELNETFFSPCHGVVFDKFGVMWNLVAQK